MLYIYIEVDSQTSELDKNFEVETSKFNLKRPLTSMTSKMALPNVLKIVSNQYISSNDSWEV